MNQTQLTAFAAVAEAGSFTRGAERLMVSQPAVSLHVAQLEASLKTPLFDRLPRGVRLTAAGEILLRYARRLSALEHEAEAAVAELLGLTRGRLVLGASLTIGSYLLPAVLGRFRRLHPAIEVDLQIANTQHIEQMLADGQIDLALTEGLPPDTPLPAETFANDRLLPIAPPGHPILRTRPLTAAVLAKQDLILREIGSGTREVVENAFARHRLTLKPMMSLGSTEAIKRAVQAGVGLAVVSELAIDQELAGGALAVIPVTDLSIVRPLTLRRPPGRTDSPAAVEFVRLLREHPAPAKRPTPRAKPRRSLT